MGRSRCRVAEVRPYVNPLNEKGVTISVVNQCNYKSFVIDVFVQTQTNVGQNGEFPEDCRRVRVATFRSDRVHQYSDVNQ